MMDEALRTIQEADLILFVTQPKLYHSETENRILADLAQRKIPILLVINKTDRFSKEENAEAVSYYQGKIQAKETILISALRDQKVDALLTSIFSCLPEGPMYYDEDTVTEIPVRAIVAEIIREKTLRLLKEEIPHGIAVTIEKMKQRKDGMWDIEATLYCERESHKGIVIGKNGLMLKQIGTEARQDAEKLLEDKVNLKLWVKVKENWRENEKMMKEFGYKKENG